MTNRLIFIMKTILALLPCFILLNTQAQVVFTSIDSLVPFPHDTTRMMLRSSSTQPQLTTDFPRITPVSPEAASLAKYINYPVNYGTGLVRIEIPLYEIQDGDLKLPITLSYHSSGIKVNEPNGWVGLGWTLNAEPFISSNINGVADDRGYLRTNSQNLGYNEHENLYLLRIVDGLEDEEPDDFHYKLADKTGSFYYSRQPRTRDTAIIVPHPYEPLKIISNFNLNPDFNITDEKGIHYEFPYENSELSTYVPNPHQTVSTAWKASKMRSGISGRQISFSYHEPIWETTFCQTDYVTLLEHPVYEFLYTNHEPVSYFLPVKKTRISNCFEIFQILHDGDESIFREYNDHADLADGRYYLSNHSVLMRKVKEIRFSAGIVKFEIIHKVDGGRMLNSIKVCGNSGNTVREIRFFQNCFLPVLGGVGRYKLDSLQILDRQGKVEERYRFEYNTQIPMPSVIDKNTDHWGYYNGTANDGSQSAVPLAEVSVGLPGGWGYHRMTTIGSASKEPDEEYMQAGVLTKIIYPTGGETMFFYQANRYYDYEHDTPKLAGGLRIHQIREIDNTNLQHVFKEFSYGLDGNGYGIPRKIPDIDDYMVERENLYVKWKRLYIGGAFIDYAADYFDQFRSRTYSSSPVINLSHAGGAPVLYEWVSEYKHVYHSEDEMEKAGLTRYQYGLNYDLEYNTHRVPGTSITLDPKADWLKGKLVSCSNYKVDNGVLVPVDSVHYWYSTYNRKDIPVGKVEQKTRVYDPDPDETACFSRTYLEELVHHPYEIYSGCLRLSNEYRVQFDSRGKKSLETETSYEYNNPVLLYPTRIRTTASDGKQLDVRRYYPHDLVLSGEEETARKQLMSDSRWRIGTLLKESVTKGSMATTVHAGYKVFPTGVFPWKISSQTNSAAPRERIRYHNYDAYGNPVHITQDDSIRVIYLWNKLVNSPLAEIKGATYEQVGVCLGMTPEQFTVNSSPNSLDNGLLQTGLPRAVATSFSYEPLVGLKAITNPGGARQAFEYDDFLRLRELKDNDGRVIETYKYHYQK